MSFLINYFMPFDHTILAFSNSKFLISSAALKVAVPVNLVDPSFYSLFSMLYTCKIKRPFPAFMTR